MDRKGHAQIQTTLPDRHGSPWTSTEVSGATFVTTCATKQRVEEADSGFTAWDRVGKSSALGFMPSCRTLRTGELKLRSWRCANLPHELAHHTSPPRDARSRMEGGTSIG